MKNQTFRVIGSMIVLVLTATQNQAESTYEPYTFSTLAGIGPGSADGTGSAARFNHPSGVVVDGAGNVYVADTDNHTIRKVTQAGVVTTLAGLAGYAGSTDGIGSAARFNHPSGVAVDSTGNVYVADSGNDTIRKVTPEGVVTTLDARFGDPLETRFTGPLGVAVDSAGNVYVADHLAGSGEGTLRKVTPVGVVTTLAAC